MSVELVSRSLDLDIDPSPSKEKKHSSKSKDAMGIIKTNRQGVWSELRRLERKQKKDVREKRKKRKIKSAIEKYQEENANDHTQSNVEALLRITELGRVGDREAEKILYRQPCQLSRDLKKTEVAEQEETSLFTEEDFKKFEKEYRPQSKKS